MLFFSLTSLDLFFQWFLILLFEYFLLFILLVLNFCLLLLKLFDLRWKSLNLIILDLTHFKALLFIKLLSLPDFLIYEILLSFFSKIIDDFWFNKKLPCFLRYYSILAYYYFSFWISRALSYLFFSLIIWTYLRFCIFLALLYFSFSSYSRMAVSAFNLKSYPSYISYLYLLTYCLMTCLCCFFRFF